MTGRDWISASLKLLGAIAAGESLSADDASDGLTTANRLLDSWSNEGLLAGFQKVRDSFSLTIGTSAYTMGSGATFNSARPQQIDVALLRDETLTPAIEYPMRILSEAEYAAITAKDVQSTAPYALYSDGAYPNVTLNIYPVPSAARKLVLFSWKPLSTLASIDTALSLPPGYERALVYNLAIDLAPPYSRPVTPALAEIAAETKALLKRMNHRQRFLRINDVPANRSNIFDYRTGELR